MINATPRWFFIVFLILLPAFIADSAVRPGTAVYAVIPDRLHRGYGVKDKTQNLDSR
jgi:hypothetical protein